MCTFKDRLNNNPKAEGKSLDRDHILAMVEASIVTFLWSSSYILVKFGLTQLSPMMLVFTGALIVQLKRIKQ